MPIEYAPTPRILQYPAFDAVDMEMLSEVADRQPQGSLVPLGAAYSPGRQDNLCQEGLHLRNSTRWNGAIDGPELLSFQLIVLAFECAAFVYAGSRAADP